MSTYLVQYAGVQHRSAAGFGGEWDADRRHGTRRTKAARRDSGRVWARARRRFTGLMPATVPGLVIAR
jgi:hypothetical protein